MSTTKKQDFKITDEIKKIIVKKLNNPKINEDNILFGLYNNEIRASIKGSYLAHYIRSLEQQLKIHTKNPLFSIIVRPFPASSKNYNVSVGQYFANRCVTIYYHPDMDEIYLRDCLAHEIGHVFICTLFSKQFKNQNKSYKDTEPLASLIGILFMIDIDDFYNKRCKEYAKRSHEHIIDNFIDINNSKKRLNS